jgi:hypothetical protein
MTREKWKYKVDGAIPCPFCGSESISVQHAEARYIGQNCFGVKKHIMKAYCVCNKCYSRGGIVKYVGYSDAGQGFYDEEHLPIYSCGDKAIELWNRRVGKDD